VKQFCLRGHDTLVVGRYRSGGCRECNRIDSCERGKRLERREQIRRWKESLRGRVKVSAYNRRYYLAHKEAMLAQSAAWAKAHPVESRESKRKSRLKYRGVNFWVEAAKESV
jgi:hypothetical protein